MQKDINEFLVYLENERRYPKTTIDSYRLDLEIFYSFFNNYSYPNIKKDEIRLFLKHLDKLKYSTSTISRILSTLRHFYDYLLIQNKVTSNIFKSIRNPKKEKKMPNFLQYDELTKIINSIELTTPLDIRNRLIIELLYATGIRVSELTSLKIEDINLKSKEIKILGKGNKERIVFYGDYAKEILDLYLSQARPNLLNHKKNPYLILNKYGDSITRRGIEEIISNIIKKLALKHKVSPHTLRHTFATDMLNNGADLKSVQELLGHSSLSTTQIYTHLTNERLKSVYLKSFPRREEGNSTE